MPADDAEARRKGEPSTPNRLLSLGLLVLLMCTARQAKEAGKGSIDERPNGGVSAKPRRETRIVTAVLLRVGFPFLVLILTGVAVFAIVTDRPSRNMRVNDIQAQFSSTVAIGTLNPDDFSGVSWLDQPALAFENTKDGAWKGSFSAALVSARPQVLGTFVVILPPGTKVQEPTPDQLGFTPAFSVDASARLTVVYIGINSTTPYRPGMGGNARAIGFKFTLPHSLGDSVGHGRQHFIIIYSSIRGYPIPDFVPLNPITKGPGALEPDREASLRRNAIPARIGLTYNGRDEVLTDVSPDPTGGLPNSVFWRVDEATPGIVLQGTIEDRDTRWWLERAPDFLFAVFGFLLGAWGPWLRTFRR